ncbi:MAG: hypothetical protein RL328_27, partial [Acidobacteriota bacterium]
MSWSEETRCLFCDGKLPLYRKLSQGQFCSKAHQEAYWLEQEKLAVESLHRTHDALQAYKPSVSIESILGPAPVAEPVASPVFVDVEPPFAGLLAQTSRVTPTPMTLPAMIGVDPVEYEMVSAVATPALIGMEMQPLNSAGDEPISVETPTDLAEEPEAGLLALPESEAREIEPWQPVPFEAEFTTELLSLPTPEMPALDAVPQVELASIEAVAWDALEPVSLETVAGPSSAVGFRENNLMLPEFQAAPCDEELEQIEDQLFPRPEQLLVLPAPVHASTPVRPAQPELTPEAFAAGAPALNAALTGAPADFAPNAAASLFAIEIAAAADMQVSVRVTEPVAAEFAASAPELGTVALSPAGSDPEMGHLAALSLSPSAVPAEIHKIPAEPTWAVPALAYPSAVATASELLIRAQATGVLRLDFRERMEFRAGSYSARGPVLPAPVERDVQLPRPSLTPDHRTSPLAQAEGIGQYTHLLTGIQNFWRQAPRDLKILLFAVPVAIGLAFHPSLPVVTVQAPQSGAEVAATAAKDAPGFFERVVSSQVANVKKAIADRAAIGLDENFREGLDKWMGNSGSTAEWSFDQAGFVLPGRVALYQPSLGLKDYELQFLGAIDKGALSWVVRAADFQNYYVVKLAVVKEGVIPQLGIIRYAVINGKPMDRVDTPVALNTRVDALYRVRMEMQGDR